MRCPNPTPGLSAHLCASIGAVASVFVFAAIAGGVVRRQQAERVRNEMPTEITVNGQQVDGAGDAVFAVGRELLSGARSESFGAV